MPLNKLPTLALRTLIVSALLLLIGCSSEAPDNIDTGTIENGQYHNAYFGMRASLNPDWHLQERKTIEELMDLGGSLIAGDDENLRRALKSSELNTVPLFALFKYPVGAPRLNPNINAVAERVDHLPAIKTGRDYLEGVRFTLQSGQMQVSFPGKIEAVQLGGRQVHVMRINISLGQIELKQKYYATVIKGYAVGFVATYGDTTESAEMDAIIQSVTFE